MLSGYRRRLGLSLTMHHDHRASLGEPCSLLFLGKVGLHMWELTHCAMLLDQTEAFQPFAGLPAVKQLAWPYIINLTH